MSNETEDKLINEYVNNRITHFVNTHAHHQLITMAVSDDGKRYNVWSLKHNCWTNSNVDGCYQDPNKPDPLNYDNAVALLTVLRSWGWTNPPDLYEIRELTTTKATTIQPSSVKSSGMKCRKCQEFNSYAEANQSDGSFCCFGCRR